MRYFKGKKFKKDIILVAVGRLSLSYRDVSEILKEHDVSVHPTTIMRCLHEYDHLIYQIWKKKNKNVELSWKLDETYIKVKGKWRYLYRAIDKEGHTLDTQLRKKRDYRSAHTFMKRLVKLLGEPTVLTTDKASALLCTFKKLKEQGFYKRTTHCTVKHLNNLIKQDHRHVKRRFAKSAGFQSILHASRTLKSIETVHALYKQKRSLQQSKVIFSTYNESQQLLMLA
ncbi:IS6 family transposase [Bacillus cereus]|uniref:IS6 family transposase n=1 Tax=Bacillus cereus group sp. MYBK34-1 TaxID=3450631 RepID=UPI003F7AEFE5|nr:IS6 family transposase [Bacillus cereus]